MSAQQADYKGIPTFPLPLQEIKPTKEDGCVSSTSRLQGDFDLSLAIAGDQSHQGAWLSQLNKHTTRESDCLFVLPYLNTREYNQQFHGKVWQLKHDAAAFSTPLLLPAVEPVGDQAPAEADKTLLSHHLLPCASHTLDL